MTLFLPEASLIGLVVAAREGRDLVFDRLRTFDFLNFCVTARSVDMDLELTVPEKLLMINHSIGRVPLESPVPFPSNGLRAATEALDGAQR